MIAASPRQQGNPVLKHIRNVPYEFVEGITPDFGTSIACIHTHEWSSRLRALTNPLARPLTTPPQSSNTHKHAHTSTGTVLGASTCCLYISLRFHLLQPQYLIRRIKELRRCVKDGWVSLLGVAAHYRDLGRPRTPIFAPMQPAGI